MPKEIYRLQAPVSNTFTNTKKQTLGIRPNRSVLEKYRCSDNTSKGLAPNDSDWARTSDLYPVKVALSQLSYGIGIMQLAQPAGV